MAKLANHKSKMRLWTEKKQIVESTSDKSTENTEKSHENKMKIKAMTKERKGKKRM